MTFFGPRKKKPTPNDEQLTEQRLDAATRKVPLNEFLYQVQDLILALIATFRRNMSEEAFARAQAEFSVLVKENRWEAYFRPPGVSPSAPREDRLEERPPL